METFDFFISYIQDYVKVQQIYESHLFLLGRYSLNSGIYVKINRNWKFINQKSFL